MAFWIYFACPLDGECSLSLLVNKFRGSWIPFQVGWWRGHSKISWKINEGFIFSGWRSIKSNSHLSPHSLISSSPLPHTLILWRTSWSDYSVLLRMVDEKYLIYDVWLFNSISIFYVSQNIRNTCMKGLHSPCSWITSFHGFGFNIEVSLYHICTRTFIWVLWWCGRNIWCMYLIYYFHILFNINIINTCMKSLHTHALVSLVFMDFGFNLEVVLYQICMRDILWDWGCCGSHIWCINL